MNKSVVVILSVLLCFLFGIQQDLDEEDALSSQEAYQECLQEDEEGQGWDKPDYSLGKQKDIAPYTDFRFQTTQFNANRAFKTFLQLTREAYQKRQNNLHKVSESTQIVKSLKCSSLRKRAGHWTYVLRKILI